MAEAEEIFKDYDRRLSGAFKYQQKCLEFLTVITNNKAERLVDIKLSHIHKDRTKHFFRNDLKLKSKWCAGRFLHPEDKMVFFVPTNLPQLSYLDLPESTFVCGNYDSDILVKETMKENKYLDYETFSIGCKQSKQFEKLQIVYANDVRSIMQKEHVNIGLISLLKRWDAEKFIRLLNFFVQLPVEGNTYSYSTCCLLVSLLHRHSTDSQLIANSVGRLCLLFPMKSFTQLTSLLFWNYISFILRHVKISSNYAADFGQHKKWLLNETLVEMKFLMGDITSLKILFSYNCESLFDAGVIWDSLVQLPSSDFWPRKSIGGNSFNSLRYHVHLTCFLVMLLSVSPIKKKYMQECIRMIFRYIPTPIIPVEDMQTFLLLMSHYFGWEEMWKQLFAFPPEFVSATYQPRSLLHLSRCVILRNLWAPDLLSLLHVPRQLQEYLLLCPMDNR